MKKTPKFNTEQEERAFWENTDSADYIDWEKARHHVSMPHLKPSTKTISIRLPEYLLEDIRTLANRRDVPYQSLLKLILEEAVSIEMTKQY